MKHDECDVMAEKVNVFRTLSAQETALTQAINEIDVTASENLGVILKSITLRFSGIDQQIATPNIALETICNLLRDKLIEQRKEICEKMAAL